MSSNLRAPDLDELPTAAQALARSTLEAGRKLVHDSITSSLASGSPTPNLLAIRSSALKLRIYLASEGERIIFFFFKQKLSKLRLIETTLQFSLQAVEDDRGLPPSSTHISYRLVAPPHWVLRPSDDELRRYAPAGARAEDVLLLRTGTSSENVFGICNPERGEKARAVYTTTTAEALKSWRAAPFLELIETLRDWLTGDKAGAQEALLDLPHDPMKMNHVHTTLYWLVEGFLRIELEVLRAKANPLPLPLARISPSYQSAGYSADLAITVDSKGRFATPDEPNPVALGLKLHVAREAGELIGRIALQPPDFLAEGPLRDAFMDALERDAVRTAKLRKTLEMTGDEAWKQFLKSAAPRAVIFRTERGKSADTDAVVLPGTWNSQPRTLILSIDATVNAVPRRPEVRLSRVSFLYDSLTDADQNLDDKTVAYFMRLAAALKDWLSLLR